LSWHTIDAFGLSNQHNDDDHNTNALYDGGDVQKDIDYHGQNRGPKDVGPYGPFIICISKANH
jgi:hypothetical protein